MCGIMGYIAPNASQEWRFKLAWRLLLETSIRGRDATGLGWHDEEGKPQVFKEALKADDFINLPAFDALEGVMPSTLIGHCRAKTKGDPAISGNNHPVVSDESGIMLVHNGHISNDDVWRQKNEDGSHYLYAPFTAQVDTEALLRVVETMYYIPRGEKNKVDTEAALVTPRDQWTPRVSMLKAIDDAVYNLEGGQAVALLNPSEPNVLYLWRTSQPLYLAYFPKQEAIVFASTEDILKRAVTARQEFIFGYIPKRSANIQEYHGYEITPYKALRVEWAGDGTFNITHQELPLSSSKKQKNFEYAGADRNVGIYR